MTKAGQIYYEDANRALVSAQNYFRSQDNSPVDNYRNDEKLNDGRIKLSQDYSKKN